MSIEKIDTLVVGAGQAGVAMSEHLSNCGVPHLILERQRIAERWRSERWDSLVANGPAWHDRFPGMEFSDFRSRCICPQGARCRLLRRLRGKDRCADPLWRGGQRSAQECWLALVSESKRRNGVIEANSVVAATGPFQKPIMPPLVPDTAGITQIHSNAYRNPEQLPRGRGAGGWSRVFRRADCR